MQNGHLHILPYLKVLLYSPLCLFLLFVAFMVSSLSQFFFKSVFWLFVCFSFFISFSFLFASFFLSLLRAASHPFYLLLLFLHPELVLSFFLQILTLSHIFQPVLFSCHFPHLFFSEIFSCGISCGISLIL